MSERTIAEKLQVKSGDVVGVIGEVDLVGPLPNGASFVADTEGVDVAVVFVADRTALHEQFAARLPHLAGARAVWFCYRKGTGFDVNRDTIMRDSGEVGWRPVSNVAVDELWSAVRVRPLAPDEQPLR